MQSTRPSSAPLWRLLALTLTFSTVGCASLRTTDSPRTATEQALLNLASTAAVEQLSAVALRDRLVYIDPTYLVLPAQEQAYMLATLRARLLESGVRLVPDRAAAKIILEIRSAGVGIDRHNYVVGIPSIFGSPELGIIKQLTQRGYATVAYVAYWADTGELVASSGPFTGRTFREDYWLFGTGPRTVGNLPTTEKPR